MINWELLGKQGKYYFSITKAPRLFRLVWTFPLVAGPGLEARELSKFLEDPTFEDGFDNEDAEEFERMLKQNKDNIIMIILG